MGFDHLNSNDLCKRKKRSCHIQEVCAETVVFITF